MKFIEKLAARNADFGEKQTATVVCFGDSVTHGCFELCRNRQGNLETVYEMRNGYPEKLRSILLTVFPRAAANVVNSGVSGDTTRHALGRMDRDVFAYSPDLVVVAFGLNDCMGSVGISADEYEANLAEMFRRIRAAGAEAIYLTPNRMCSYVDPNIRDELIRSSAQAAASVQEAGGLDKYLERGKAAARAEGAKICDANAVWNRLEAVGADTTALLSNAINHPARDMQWLFAAMLFETVLAD